MIVELIIMPEPVAPVEGAMEPGVEEPALWLGVAGTHILPLGPDRVVGI